MQYLNYIMLLVGVTENERQRDGEGESERKVYVVLKKRNVCRATLIACFLRINHADYFGTKLENLQS